MNFFFFFFIIKIATYKNKTTCAFTTKFINYCEWKKKKEIKKNFISSLYQIHHHHYYHYKPQNIYFWIHHKYRFYSLYSIPKYIDINIEKVNYYRIERINYNWWVKSKRCKKLCVLKKEHINVHYYWNINILEAGNENERIIKLKWWI